MVRSSARLLAQEIACLSSRARSVLEEHEACPGVVAIPNWECEELANAVAAAMPIAQIG